MNELNKAELRNYAERALIVGAGGNGDPVPAVIVDAAGVLSLLDECDKLQDDTSSMRGSLRSYAENMKKQVRLNTRLQRERDAALAELEALRIQVATLTEWYSNALDVISEVSAAIPGVTYMDPPDGGDVSIPEQIRRMAKDAKRYLWLRTADWWSSPLCVVRDPKQQAKPGTDCPSRDRLDSAIDAAMSQEANHDQQ